MEGTALAFTQNETVFQHIYTSYFLDKFMKENL